MEPVDAPLSRFERRLLESYPAVVVIGVVLLTVSRDESYRGDIRYWDWLLISGVLTFLVAYPLTLWQSIRVVEVLCQLREREVLPATEATREFETRLHTNANRLASAWSWGCAGVMAVVWIVTLADPQHIDWRFVAYSASAGGLLEGLLALPVGRFLGRMIGYGTLGRWLRLEGVVLRPVPDHPDGRAGLAPVGSLCLGNTVMVMLIAAFLSAWVLLLPALGPQYTPWRGTYAVLLVAVLAAAGLSIIIPLRHFHVLLAEAKRDMLQDAATNDDGRRIEAMPTWILNAHTCWNLLGVTILLLLPDVLYLMESVTGS